MQTSGKSMTTKTKSSSAIASDIEQLQTELETVDREARQAKTDLQRQILEASQQKREVEAKERAAEVERNRSEAMKRFLELDGIVNKLSEETAAALEEIEKLLPKTRSKQGSSGMYSGEVNMANGVLRAGDLPKMAISDDGSQIWIGKRHTKPVFSKLR